MVFTPDGLELTRPDQSVVLPWEAAWVFDTWGQWDRFGTFGLAVRAPGIAREVFRVHSPLRRVLRVLARHGDLVPIRSSRVDSGWPTIGIRLVEALRTFVATRPEARLALTDEDRLKRLATDMRSWRYVSHSPPLFARSLDQRIAEAMEWTRHVHVSQPMPDWVPPDTDDATDEVLDRLANDQGYDRSELEPAVRQKVIAYVEAAPWPFRALID